MHILINYHPLFQDFDPNAIQDFIDRWPVRKPELGYAWVNEKGKGRQINHSHAIVFIDEPTVIHDTFKRQLKAWCEAENSLKHSGNASVKISWPEGQYATLEGALAYLLKELPDYTYCPSSEIVTSSFSGFDWKIPTSMTMFTAIDAIVPIFKKVANNSRITKNDWCERGVEMYSDVSRPWTDYYCDRVWDGHVYCNSRRYTHTSFFMETVWEPMMAEGFTVDASEDKLAQLFAQKFIAKKSRETTGDGTTCRRANQGSPTSGGPSDL